MSTRKDGTFSRVDFHYDPNKNIYTCPAGKVLKTTGRVHDGRVFVGPLAIGFYTGVSAYSLFPTFVFPPFLDLVSVTPDEFAAVAGGASLPLF